MGRFAQAALVGLVASGAFFALKQPPPACGLLPEASAGELVLWSRRVVTEQGTLAAAVHIRDGKFASIRLEPELPPGALDYGDLVISPVSRRRSRFPPRSGVAHARAAEPRALRELIKHAHQLLFSPRPRSTPKPTNPRASSTSTCI